MRKRVRFYGGDIDSTDNLATEEMKLPCFRQWSNHTHVMGLSGRAVRNIFGKTATLILTYRLENTWPE